VATMSHARHGIRGEEVVINVEHLTLERRRSAGNLPRRACDPARRRNSVWRTAMTRDGTLFRKRKQEILGCQSRNGGARPDER